VRIAATADLHFRTTEDPILKEMFRELPRYADVLIAAGDLTDNGRLEEAEIVNRYFKSLKMPVIAVLGNHDHENDHAEEIAQLLSAGGTIMLDGNAHEIDEVGFAGTKGFCGGFGSMLVQPFGERPMKTFINLSIEEAVRLESAIKKIHCEKKVIVLHYSPVMETLQGEPPELYAFLGTSRLANAIDRQGANLIVHGHAHNGSPDGVTQAGIPVHNVSRYVQKRFGDQNYCVFNI
jgi:uncharacterized protein